MSRAVSMVNGRPQRSRRAPPDRMETLAPTLDLRELAQECFQITVETLLELGLSRKQSDEAMTRALHSRRKSRPSSEMLQRYSEVSSILRGWRREKRFLTPEGEPKVLPVYGKGATFEALARKYAPGAPVKVLVDYICLYGDATRLTKNKVALVGSNVLIVEKTPQVAMAAINQNFRQLTYTILKNTNTPAKGTGLFQRMVRGFLSEKGFQKFAKEIRPHLHDLCSVVDDALEPGRKVAGRKRMCGMSLYLFQDRESG